jgi:hypothetical protein
MRFFHRIPYKPLTVILTIIIVIVLIIAAYFHEITREAGKLAPPEGCTTLQRFKNEMPVPRNLELFSHSGVTYILWTGELCGPLYSPSGPSFYLFDNRGNLLKWQHESGEGAPLDKMVSSAIDMRKITIEDAISLCEAAGRSVQGQPATPPLPPLNQDGHL